MCGIVGVVGTDDALEIVLNGLKKLEYRGYDSAGVAVPAEDIQVCKAVGKIVALEEELAASPLPAAISVIGHTRWATHGVPSEANAHPHVHGKIAVVHNGILENYEALRRDLQGQGVVFYSETDSEVIPAYLNQQTGPLLARVQAFVAAAEGAFALGILDADNPEMLIGTRRGAPLCVGLGKDCNYLGSDPMALAEQTNRFIFLKEDDIAVLTPTEVTIYRPDGTPIEREVKVLDAGVMATGKSGFKHFMLKEMHEQPDVVNRILAAYVRGAEIHFPETLPALTDVAQVNIIACGTAFYAGLCGKTAIEQYCKTPVNVDVASEFRYRQPPYVAGGLFIAVSQSGETADTLAALEDARQAGQHIVVITNTPTSSMARAADTLLELHAGPEIAVASTKAFVAMQTVLTLLALQGSGRDIAVEIQALRELPSKIQQVLAMGQDFHALAQEIHHATSMLYLGRGPLAPLALEGALKLKEISYIHAEGYASGEMKHGPIALVDETLPVVNLASSTDSLLEKTVSNMKEIEARRGQVILITDKAARARLDAGIQDKANIIEIPVAHPVVAPMVFAVPLQLLAYHVAVEKGTDVDQPRNLAKSVTVE